MTTSVNQDGAPLVSVVIPAYRSATTLKAAVDCVLNQTFNEVEAIVINDGSPDDTDQVMVPFAGHPRVSYHKQENRGPSGTRNAAIRISNAPFIALLDSDDLMSANAIELMVNALQESGADFCITDLLLIHNGTQSRVRAGIPDDPRAAILAADFITRAPMFRREALLRIGLYDETIRAREDWDLHLRAFEAGLSFAYLASPVYIYQVGPAGGSRNRTSMLQCTERVLAKHHKRLAEAGDQTAAKCYADNLWDLARSWAVETGNWRRALSCAVRCILWERSLTRVWRMMAARVRAAVVTDH